MNKIIELLEEKAFDMMRDVRSHMTLHSAEIFTVKLEAYIELLELLQSSIDRLNKKGNNK